MVSKFKQFNLEIDNYHNIFFYILQLLHTFLLFKKLNAAFEKSDTTKDEVVYIMSEYLPNFEHIETGKSLDSKM